MPTPYRGDAPNPTNGREEAAVAELARRALVVRRLVIVAVLLVTMPLGLAGYLLVQEAQFAHRGIAFVWLNVVLGVGVPLGVAFRLLDRIVRATVRAVVRSSIGEIAAMYDMPEDSLAELASALR